jgi:hypothetical protein
VEKKVFSHFSKGILPFFEENPLSPSPDFPGSPDRDPQRGAAVEKKSTPGNSFHSDNIIIGYIRFTDFFLFQARNFPAGMD